MWGSLQWAFAVIQQEKWGFIAKEPGGVHGWKADQVETLEVRKIWLKGANRILAEGRLGEQASIDWGLGDEESGHTGLHASLQGRGLLAKLT